MHWEHLQTLLAVAKGGTLAAAGVSLGLDRSTVSRRLSALEDELGTPLFARTRDGLVLTPAGERARLTVEQMAESARGLSRLGGDDGGPEGVVRVAVTEALAPYLVEQGLLEVTRQAPRVQVELLAGNRRLDLERDEADLAVRLDPLTGANLKARCLARMPMGLFAAPAYLRTRGVPTSAANLAGHDVLLPSAELARLPEARWLAAQKKVRVALRSNSPLALLAAAKAGHGLVALTLPWGEREPGLERVLVLTRIPERAVWLVTTAAASKRPAVSLVADHLAAHFLSPRRP